MRTLGFHKYPSVVSLLAFLLPLVPFVRGNLPFPTPLAQEDLQFLGSVALTDYDPLVARDPEVEK